MMTSVPRLPTATGRALPPLQAYSTYFSLPASALPAPYCAAAAAPHILTSALSLSLAARLASRPPSLFLLCNNVWCGRSAHVVTDGAAVQEVRKQETLTEHVIRARPAASSIAVCTLKRKKTVHRV
ncbi:hypothetical protein XELAEV_18007960mg [Xenopus laevis]|uniref:Uncharacterized protein n=1 Tax=Xenopus laevis TaxID=8355 RepID=A0A974I5P7_XENLA|nr:hypothetical protein XELAEV_18007960mg [Xenopus laevis]